MNPKISIIVPVYKVEKYLHRCVDSILNQTFTDFECVLVDDGSPDNCGKICDDYAKKDNRIKVIHKENGGLSDARNAGLDIAIGDYIGFVDSDDWIHPQMYEILLSGIEKNDSLCSVCAFKEVYDYSDTTTNILEIKYIVVDTLSFWLENTCIATIAWNKLYSKKLFEALRYPYGRVHEDEFTTYKVLFSLDSFTFVDIPLYFYFKDNPNSICNQKYNIKSNDILLALEERLEYFKNLKLVNVESHTLFWLIREYYNKYNLCIQVPEYIDQTKSIKKRLRTTLILYKFKFNLKVGHYIEYYNIAFPLFTKLYLTIYKIKSYIMRCFK